MYKKRRNKKDKIYIMEDNIKVSLTTSKFSPYRVDTQQTEQEYQSFVELNIPVCVSEYLLQVDMQNKEYAEHIVSNLAKEMAKEVYVDSSNKCVFIGEDHNKEITGIVVYSVFNLNKYEIEFFKRWDETKTMLFEHQVKDFNNQEIFILKGLWLKDKWKYLEILPSSRIHIK